MIYTKRRRTLLAKAVVNYSSYLFVSLVVGQLLLWRENPTSKGNLLNGAMLVLGFLSLAFFLEPSED